MTGAGNTTVQELSRFTFTEYHMGIDARIVVYAPDESRAKTACRAAFRRIAELEAILSDYRPTSELMKLCGKAHEGPVRVSPELFLLLRKAQELSEKSGGAFDVTVGPLVQLWRKARREAKLPSAIEIDNAKKLVGWRMIELDSDCRTVKLATEGMRLDLGGIAKGYAGDEALKELRRNGVKSALIELGGDIVMGDAPPNTEGWTIGVPNAHGAGKSAEIKLKNCAISSSGDTEQFVVIDGRRYSHVVDPRTGYGLSHRTQASIIAKTGLQADPLSTALTILDEPSRNALLRRTKGVQAFIRTATE